MAICPKPVQASRKNDLQGIRGIAILSVLGFHFYPKTFPNGYLGVDQFFVLSGYLMCMILTRSQKHPIHKMFFEFYTRRFRRILPLYFLFILSTILALYTVFPETAVFLNELSAEKALLFVSNRPHSREEDYFEKLSLAIDLFTHTWSLSVEIQFYLIAPIIFLIGHRFKGASKHAYYSTTATISFIFHIFSPPTTSFNSVFARIWQFLIGMMVYLWSRSQSLPYAKNFESEDEETSKTGNLFVKCLVLTSIIAMLLFPKALDPILVRPLMTLCTASLLLFNVEDWILNSRFLMYLGDVSYALYLVHWPVYAYCRLSFPPNFWILNGALLLSVVLGIVVFETYEKWYLKQSNMVIAVLVMVLFLSSGLLVNVDQIRDSIQKKTFDSEGRKFPRLDGVTANMTFAEDWYLFDRIELTKSIRHSADQEFADLSRWAEGEIQPWDLQYFKKRELCPNGIDYKMIAQKFLAFPPGQNAILCSNGAAVEKYNEAVVKELTPNKHVMLAYRDVHQRKVKGLRQPPTYEEQEQNGYFLVGKGLTVLFTGQMVSIENIRVKSGTYGVIEGFEMDRGIVNRLRLLIQGKPYHFVRRHEELPRYGDLHSLVSQRFELTNSYAFVVHRAQGMTLDKVIVDTSDGLGTSMGYSAFSRVRTGADLFITHLPQKSHYTDLRNIIKSDDSVDTALVEQPLLDIRRSSPRRRRTPRRRCFTMILSTPSRSTRITTKRLMLL